MLDILKVIGRSEELFADDVSRHEEELQSIIRSSSFLVLGASGSIGQAVCRQIFKRNPKKLHLVDINENNMTEVVRDLHRNVGQPDQSFSERQIYEQARDRLASELAAVEKTDVDKATTKLEQILEAA